MNYHAGPGMVLPATGMAAGMVWGLLAGLTLLVVGLAVMRLWPKREA